VKYQIFHREHRRYFASTVGCDEEKIRAYIRNQEDEEHRLQQRPLIQV